MTYNAMKRHFTTESYDFHKYHGKIKASFDTFQNRTDLLFYAKLAAKPERNELILSNILKNPNVWIRDLFSQESHEVYLDWKKRTDATEYYFTQDLSKLKEDYSSNFLVEQGQYPHLLTLLLRKQISLETFTILIHISNVLLSWETQLADQFLAKDILLKAKKYHSFLNYDTKKFKLIVKDLFFN